MRWFLFLDDVRMPAEVIGTHANLNDFTIARSSKEAIALVKERGLPLGMYLDHDLGGEDTTMIFLKEMVSLFPEGPCPAYLIHSGNPVGKKNIDSFLLSWERSLG
jgi:hypothetical protein